MPIAAEARDRFLSLVLANPWNAVLLARMVDLGASDAWLVSGCLAQSVWNGLYGKPPDHAIRDYDIAYYDPDTTWGAEDAVIRKAAVLFRDLPITVEIRNQARVPLWYQRKFGVAFPPVNAATDGINRFPCATTALGIRRGAGTFTLHAPFGINLALTGRLQPNPCLPIPTVYEAKTKRWHQIWPDLTIEPWPEPPQA
jgi:hypothetical protein